MAKKPLEISKNAKMGLGVVNARYLPTNITLPEAPWESSDEDSDVDFETYYDRDYSLSKMTTEEYIRDDRFEVIGL